MAQRSLEDLGFAGRGEDDEDEGAAVREACVFSVFSADAMADEAAAAAEEEEEDDDADRLRLAERQM
jgi:hypothetical protein